MALVTTYLPSRLGALQVTLEGGRTAALAIWDTAGSSQFAHLSRMFIRGTDVVLVCYDVTSRDDWERLKIWVRPTLLGPALPGHLLWQAGMDGWWCSEGGMSGGGRTARLRKSREHVVAAASLGRHLATESAP